MSYYKHELRTIKIVLFSFYKHTHTHTHTLTTHTHHIHSHKQAYGFFLESQNTFKVTKISSSIPCTKSRDEFSLDGIKFIKLHNRTHLFVRSQTNHSRIHYGYQEWSKGVWSSFDGIADDDNHLKYDFEI